MKKIYYVFLLLTLFATHSYAQVATLRSGDVELRINQEANADEYGMSLFAFGQEINTPSKGKPVTFSMSMRDSYYVYNSLEVQGEQLILTAQPKSRNGSEFKVTDIYTAAGNGAFELQRKVVVIKASETNPDESFYTSFGLVLPYQTAITDNEYFVPAVWYRGNFMPEGNIPANISQPTDKEFLYREDRITLPVVMVREKTSALTFTLIHKDSECNTVLKDSEAVTTDEGYQFGGVGVKQDHKNKITSAMVTYPGSDMRKSGRGERSHPVKPGVRHAYKVYFKIDKTETYAEAVHEAWETAYEMYNPEVRTVDLISAYKGMIETLDYTFVPDRSMRGVACAPGFPWGTSLHTFKPTRYIYESGFVGCQPGAGYALFRGGIEFGNQSYRERGEAVVDLWARGLSSLGLPSVYYNPRMDGGTGGFSTWDKPTIRQTATAMGSILNAWCFAKRNGVDKPNWYNACVRYGDFLVSHQSADGSYAFSYDQTMIINNGKNHPIVEQNKSLTICALRYLCELYIVTGNEAYKKAAILAGRFCYKAIHEPYLYVACVIDNPRTIDSESGQQAINGFLALYDLTKDKKWLDAAEQAAIYTESWSYMYEIPVEVDQASPTSFPKNRSIVGQHIIAVGHSAADLGFAWSSFVLYRLYLITGNEHYLNAARISAHNTKQSMNLNQALYPGQPEGLQLEAFQVMIPRRRDGIMEALTWNYTAHLDPLQRFKDAFGTVDIEKIEAMPMEQRLRLNHVYSYYQGGNYGQHIEIPESLETAGKDDVVRIGLIGNELSVDFKQVLTRDARLQLTDLSGKVILSELLVAGQSYFSVPVDAARGMYIATVQPAGHRMYSEKIILN